MTPRGQQCGWVWRGRIVSREGFRKNDSCEVLQDKLSQWRGSPQPAVDEFVAAKAPSLNRFQQSSTGQLQTIQQQSLRINENP